MAEGDIIYRDILGDQLYKTMGSDPGKWATAFCEFYPKVNRKIVRSWFKAALTRGFDEHRRKHGKRWKLPVADEDTKVGEECLCPACYSPGRYKNANNEPADDGIWINPYDGWQCMNCVFGDGPIKIPKLLRTMGTTYEKAKPRKKAKKKKAR
jgi:Zn-finger protein